MSRQKLRDFVWFTRPTLGVVICYFIAVSISYHASQRGVDDLDERLAEVDRIADETADLKRPKPELSPKQVAEIQVAAMADADPKRGALQCASFASPENFAVTGPLGQFARMLRGPKFLPLSSPDLVVVGDPIFQNDKARVLVTAFDGEKVRAFVWVLAKRTQAGPLNNCWMTDGVFPLSENNRLIEGEI